MSDRPAPLTTTDTMLGLVLDELQGLRADLAGRDGAPTPPAITPAAPRSKSKGHKPTDLDGR